VHDHAVLALARCYAVVGVDAVPVEVEAHVVEGARAFALVGLPDAATREARERVRASIAAAELEFPRGRVTVNLAPAGVRKEGASFDLAIALALLAATGQVPGPRLARFAVLGELALDARLRPARGALVAAEAARVEGLDGVVCPPASAAEAALVAGVDAIPCSTLRDAVAFLRGERDVEPLAPAPVAPVGGAPDLAEVRGQALARRALEIAAAGGHNLLLVGPPGVGKTMLARRLPGLLPPLTADEALEATRIHSVAGLAQPGGLLRARPFRAPHHTASSAALVGGGPHLRPGELSLATHGVLFLDELPEFRRDALEALRAPLEDGVVHIARARGTVTLPARAMLVAAMNPCPCGAPAASGCTCTPARAEAYRRRISGPLLDRIDLGVRLARPPAEALRGDRPEPTAAVRGRVVEARERQAARGPRPNARLEDGELRTAAALAADADGLLVRAADRLALSPRAIVRCLRVARTVADLAGRDAIALDDVAEAIGLRLGTVA
jgi:magnesium chelatase family protein